MVGLGYTLNMAHPSLRYRPTLNHLFIEGTGKIGPGEYGTVGHVAEVVLNDIAAWVKK